MNGDKPASLSLAVNNKTDAQIATELRAELGAALIPVVEILNRARAAGLEVGFNLGRDQTGRWIAPPINVAKPL